MASAVGPTLQSLPRWSAPGHEWRVTAARLSVRHLITDIAELPVRPSGFIFKITYVRELRSRDSLANIRHVFCEDTVQITIHLVPPAPTKSGGPQVAQVAVEKRKNLPFLNRRRCFHASFNRSAKSSTLIVPPSSISTCSPRRDSSARFGGRGPCSFRFPQPPVQTPYILRLRRSTLGRTPTPTILPHTGTVSCSKPLNPSAGSRSPPSERPHSKSNLHVREGHHMLLARREATERALLPAWPRDDDFVGRGGAEPKVRDGLLLT